jgi:hypothetical protein
VKAREILDEAKQLLNDRGNEYGDSTFNHIRIARLWSVYLDKKIEPHEVALCLILTKISRTQTTPDHADSYKDIAAYSAIAGQITSTDWNDLDSY